MRADVWSEVGPDKAPVSFDSPFPGGSHSYIQFLSSTSISLADQPQVYTGESDDLRRRTGNYRNPGPTQQTSQRIHQELISHLTAGGTVTMSVATSAVIEADGEATQLPLARKTARVLAEHTALGLAYLDAHAAIVNRDRGAE